MPDYHVKINLQNDLEPKCFVTYFPINICQNLIDSIQIETIMKQMDTYLDYESYLSKFFQVKSILKFILNKNEIKNIKTDL